MKKIKYTPKVYSYRIYDVSYQSDHKELIFNEDQWKRLDAFIEHNEIPYEKICLNKTIFIEESCLFAFIINQKLNITLPDVPELEVIFYDEIFYKHIPLLEAFMRTKDCGPLIEINDRKTVRSLIFDEWKKYFENF